jgi:hypothetical protein
VKTAKTVGIHQPNFLPWIGYFNKIIMSDVFILLDDVQYPKTGGVWTNRSLILNNGESKWATIPINRNFSGTKNINEIRFAQNNNWKESYLKQIRKSYLKSRCFSQIYDFLLESFKYETELLSSFNIHLIASILRLLEISDQTLITSSSLVKNGKSNHLLCSLVKSVDGNTYLCGAGSSEYLDTKIFELNRINIVYQNYNAIAYPQIENEKFVAGLSIIDALMHCGLNKTRQLVYGVNNV